LFHLPLSLQRLLLLLALSLAFSLNGCGNTPDDDDSASDDDDDDSASDDDDSAADDDDDDSAADDDDDSAADDDDDDDSAADDDDDDSAATDANISGMVTRSGDFVKGQDGIGTVVVTVLAQDPKAGPPGMPVAFTSVPDADLSASGASVSYSLEGLTPRVEPYYVVAFIDDDASGAMGGPNENDLVAQPVELTATTGGTYSVDLDLAGTLD